MSITTLTVRLLRPGRVPADAFTENFATGGNRALQQRQWDGIENASLYVGQIYSNPPGWLGFLEKKSSDLPQEMFSSGAGAALCIPVDGRIVVICFGHIHIALNDDAFERQFGLRVTLNTVPRSQLRTLDLATPDAVTFQKRVQASKDSDLQGFGVDMLRDLARVAGGTPSNVDFARFVAGKDSLSISCELEPNKILEKCREILLEYKKINYKNEFAWVDNMQLVSEKDIINELETKLFTDISALMAGNPSNLHMAPPEIVSYTEGNELHYNGFGSHGKSFNSLSIADYISELNRCKFSEGISEIKSKHWIKVKSDTSDNFSEKWKVYDCFVFETNINSNGVEKYYVMFAGDWYRIEKSFKLRVEKHFDELEKVCIIGRTTCNNEEDLIDHIETTRLDLLKLDKQKINPKGVSYANLEPCDFFSSNKEFIHLKDGHSSGPISHLWSQGVVSAEAMVSDADFRSKLRSKVKSLRPGFESHFPTSSQAFVRQNYKVVFGVMRKPYADGSVGLPFFSKVSLQAATQRIAQFGIPVAIELIEKPA